MYGFACPIEDYFITARFLIWEDIINKSRRIRKIAERYDDCASLLTTGADQELDELLNCAELICRYVRQAKANRYLAVRSDAKLKEIPGIGDIEQIDVTFEDGVLRIKTPPTLLRQKEQSWYMARCVKAVLEKYVEEHGRISIPLPCHVIVCRKATAVSRGYRDNENYESSRIINTVMMYLGYNDQPNRLGYTSIFRIVDDSRESCVEFTFMPESRLDIAGF